MKEFDLLHHIYNRRQQSGHDHVLIGPGDDMALVHLLHDTNNLLAAVDQVVAGCHFQYPATTPIDLVGTKAVTRSLSDIAAMAGRPLASLAAAVLPADMSDSQAQALVNAMNAAADQYHCPLIGGDVSIAQPNTDTFVISVTVLAEPGPSGRAITRAGANAGDLVYVTGQLGGSIDPATGLGRHLTFEPRIDLALELTALTTITAMIDISDGLGRDLDHIADMSGLRAVIRADTLPISPGCDWKQAVSDGEDYELCFTISPDDAGDLPDTLCGIPLTCVGAMKPSDDNSGTKPRTVVAVNDTEVDATGFGWEHRS
ncbi:MAG: thiamine-phosphate kinase [Planctomycetes bacterium]|nr:thiamine-phosphate kinase [Planctomycetota bacterium]